MPIIDINLKKMKTKIVTIPLHSYYHGTYLVIFHMIYQMVHQSSETTIKRIICFTEYKCRVLLMETSLSHNTTDACSTLNKPSHGLKNCCTLLYKGFSRTQFSFYEQSIL
jgi:hypothetical protein